MDKTLFILLKFCPNLKTNFSWNNIFVLLPTIFQYSGKLRCYNNYEGKLQYNEEKIAQISRIIVERYSAMIVWGNNATKMWRTSEFSLQCQGHSYNLDIRSWMTRRLSSTRRTVVADLPFYVVLHSHLLISADPLHWPSCFLLKHLHQMHFFIKNLINYTIYSPCAICGSPLYNLVQKTVEKFILMS